MPEPPLAGPSPQFDVLRQVGFELPDLAGPIVQVIIPECKDDTTPGLLPKEIERAGTELLPPDHQSNDIRQAGFDGPRIDGGNISLLVSGAAANIKAKDVGLFMPETVTLDASGGAWVDRKGKPADPNDFRGVYRLGLPRQD